MKATDLMIGDWLIPYNKDNPDRIKCLSWQRDRSGEYPIIEFEHDFGVWHYPTYCKPVPLTAEILEKNGFSCKGRDYYFYEIGDYGALAGYPRFGGFTEIFFQYKDAKLRMQIRYVHQLQHALRLCGIEKEIILNAIKEQL